MSARKRKIVNKCFMLSSNMCFFTKYQTFTHVQLAVKRLVFSFLYFDWKWRRMFSYNWNFFGKSKHELWAPIYIRCFDVWRIVHIHTHTETSQIQPNNTERFLAHMVRRGKKTQLSVQNHIAINQSCCSLQLMCQDAAMHAIKKEV